MRFTTDYRFTDRRTKARYVWEKYGEILRGRLLDVGADECHLREHLEPGTEYLGVGMGGHPDLEIDLEASPLPFEDGSFDCVLCLDVLEHLDNPHDVFDELCRVSRGHVIVSLPNAWADFLRRLTKGPDLEDPPLKFYGLPVEPPRDRHKWFLSAQDAREFLLYRTAKNGLTVTQIDPYPPKKRRRMSPRGLLHQLAEASVFRGGLDPAEKAVSSVWLVASRPRADP